MRKTSKLSTFYMILVFIMLYLPIGVMILFSFNESKSMTNFTGFSLRWYGELFSSGKAFEALKFSLMNPNYLGFYDNQALHEPYGGTAGFTQIECVGRYPAPAGAFPSPKAAQGWLRGHVMGMYDFLNSVYLGKQSAPSFADGAYVQRIMEAAMRSDASGREETV